MTEFKFVILRFVVDCLFMFMMFYGFMCGVHYGTHFLGLYFTFLKVTLGILGIGAMTFALRWVKSTISFVIKNGSIYAASVDGDIGVMASFSGIVNKFKATVSVTVFNKLIRESLDFIQSKISTATDGNEVVDELREFGDNGIIRMSKKLLGKAFDYVDECILGYCYQFSTEEKGLMECASEALVIFVTNAAGIIGKVFAVLSIQLLFKGTYWVCFAMFCFKTFEHSVMNFIVCYVLGKAISFILEDAVYEPLLMHSVIKQFKKYTWKPEYEGRREELSGFIPSLGKIVSHFKKNVMDGEDGDNLAKTVKDTVSDVAKESAGVAKDVTSGSNTI